LLLLPIKFVAHEATILPARQRRGATKLKSLVVLMDFFFIFSVSEKSGGGEK
jgi:hypothetical protein